MTTVKSYSAGNIIQSEVFDLLKKSKGKLHLSSVWGNSFFLITATMVAACGGSTTPVSFSGRTPDTVTERGAGGLSDPQGTVVNLDSEARQHSEFTNPDVADPGGFAAKTRVFFNDDGASEWRNDKGQDTTFANAFSDSVGNNAVGTGGNDYIFGSNAANIYFVEGNANGNFGTDQFIASAATVLGTDTEDLISFAQFNVPLTADGLEITIGAGGVVTAEAILRTANPRNGSGTDLGTVTITDVERIAGTTGDDIFGYVGGDLYYSLQGANDGYTITLSGATTATFTSDSNNPDQGFDSIARFTNLIGGNGDDNFIDGVTGNNFKDNVFYGGGGNDVLIGGTGDDELYGGAHNDILVGGAGADTLDGGANNDILIGGLGQDTLMGGAGDDVFVLIGAPGGAGATTYTDGHLVRIGQNAYDLRGILTAADLNNAGGASHYDTAAPDTIIGGEGDDIIVAFGVLDLSGFDFDAAGIRTAVINSEVTFTANDIVGLTIVGDTVTSKIIIIGGSVDLDMTSISGVREISVASDAELMISAEQIDSLEDVAISGGGTVMLEEDYDMQADADAAVDGIIFADTALTVMGMVGGSAMAITPPTTASADASGNFDDAAPTKTVAFTAFDNMLTRSELQQDITISGTFSAALVSGESLYVSLGGVAGTVTINPIDGTMWTAIFTADALVNLVGQDSITLSGVVVDRLGQNGATATQAITIDAHSSTPRAVTVATDNIVSSTEAAAGFTVTGTADTDDTVTATINVNGTDYTETATVTSDAFSITFGAADLGGVVLSAGGYTATLTASDASGNTSEQSLVRFSVATAGPVFADGASKMVTDIDEAVTGNAQFGVFTQVYDANVMAGDDSVIYTLSGTDAGSFTINADTGVVFLNADTPFNADGGAPNSYTDLTITATDRAGQSSSLELDVIPDGVNEAPTAINVPTLVIPAGLTDSRALGDLTATDEDGPLGHTFTRVSGEGDADNADFRITDEATPGTYYLEYIGADMSAEGMLRDPGETYSIRLRVDDGEGGVHEQAFVITVAGINRDGDIPAIADNQDYSGASALDLGDLSAHTEVFSGAVSFSLTEDILTGGTAVATSADGAFMIASTDTGGQLSYLGTPDYDVPDGETLSVTVYISGTDVDGEPLSFGQTFTFSVTDANDQAPTFESDASQPVMLAENTADGATVFTATASDPDSFNDVIEYSISGDGGDFVIDTATGVVTVAANADLDFETARTYNLVITAMDSTGTALSATQTLMVQLTDINDNTPTAPTGSLTSFNPMGMTDDIVGTAASTDADSTADHNTITYSLAGGGGLFAIDSGTGVVTLARAPSSPTEIADGFTVDITITATDGTRSDSTVFTLAPSAIGFESAPGVDVDQPYSLGAENAVVARTDIGTLDVSELGYTTVRFAEVAAVNNFLLDTSTGVVTFGGAAPDFDANGGMISYQVRVYDDADGDGMFDDDGTEATATRTLLFSVTDVNDEDPTFQSDVSQPVMLAENVADEFMVFDANASDPDSFNDVIAYSMTGGGTDFTIDSTTGIITVASTADLDFETTPTYNLVITAMDSTGTARSASQTLMVQLTNINEAPTDILPDVPVVAEGSDGSSAAVLVTTLTAEDEDAGDTHSFELASGAGSTHNEFFALATDGTLTYTGTADDLVDPGMSMSIRVRVSDDGEDGAQPYEKIVSVLVGGIGVDGSGAGDIIENTAGAVVLGPVTVVAGVFSGTPTITLDSASITAGFSYDPSVDNNLTYTVSGALDYDDPVTGVQSVTATFMITGTAADGATPLSFSQEFVFDVLDANDRDPVFTSADGSTVMVSESAADGTTLSYTAVATDPDGDVDGLAIAYSITSGNTGNVFAIDSSSGVLSLRDDSDVDANLDFETTDSYNLQITATSTGGTPSRSQTATQMVTVQVTNANEAPTGLDAVGSLVLPSNVMGATDGAHNVGAISASDEDAGDMLTYTLNSVDGMMTVTNGAILGFVLASDGTLTYTADGLQGKTNGQSFTLSVQVEDSLGETDTATVHVIAGGFELDGTPADDAVTARTSISEDTAVNAVIGVLRDPDNVLSMPGGAAPTYTFLPGMSDNIILPDGESGGELFAVTTDGTITLNAVLDFEAAGIDETTMFSVTVLGAGDRGVSITQTFSFSVGNLDDTNSDVTITDLGTDVTATDISGDSTLGYTVTVSVNENFTGDIFTILGSDPDDPDGSDGDIEYYILGGVDNGDFSIGGRSGADALSVVVGGSGAVAFVATPDFETPTDSDTDNEYIISFVAVEGVGGPMTTFAVTVNVNDVNDNVAYIVADADGDIPNGGMNIIPAFPVIINDLGDVSQAENTASSMITFHVYDRDTDTATGTRNQMFTLNQEAIDAGFSLDTNDDGDLELTVPEFDFENLHANFDGSQGIGITITSSDTGVAGYVDSATSDIVHSFIYTVTNVNEAPTAVTIDGEAETNIPTGTDSGSVGTLAAVDVDATDTHIFEVISVNGVTSGAPFDLFDIRNDDELHVNADVGVSGTVYTVVVRATDNGAGGSLTFNQTLTLRVGNISLSGGTALNEGEVMDHALGMVNLHDDSITAIALNAESTTAGFSYSGGLNGMLTFTGTTDYDVENGEVLEATFTVTGGPGGTSIVRIPVGNLNDEAPMFGSDTNRSNSENIAIGANLVIIPEATDADGDAFDALVYAIAGVTTTGGTDVSALYTMNAGATHVTLATRAQFNTAFAGLSASDKTALGVDAVIDNDVAYNDLLQRFIDYDVEDNRIHTISFSVTDGVNGEDTVQIAHTYTNFNDDAPALPYSQTSQTYSESTAVGTQLGNTGFFGSPTSGGTVSAPGTYRVTDSAGELSTVFGIKNNHYLLLSGALDYETATEHTITVSIQDGGVDRNNNFVTIDHTITITVNDANDQLPVFTSTAGTFMVDETAADGTAIGYTAVADDPDTGDGAVTSTEYSITSGNDDDIFGIDATSGVLTVANNANLDHETTGSYNLEITVTTTGRGGSQTATQMITVDVTDINEAPNTPTATGMINSFDLNGAAGSFVGTVSSTDEDDGDSLTYSLTQPSDLFRIDDNGVITLARVATDVEMTGGAIQIMVTANDGALDSTTALSLSLTPEMLGYSDTSGGTERTDFSIGNEESAAEAIGFVYFDEATRYEIVGTANGFSVTNTGELSYTGNLPDYDTNGGSLEVTVLGYNDANTNTTLDTAEASRMRTFEFTYDSINDERPEISALTDSSAADILGDVTGNSEDGYTLTISVNEGFTGNLFTVAATDPDGTDTAGALAYSISGGANMADFSIAGGAVTFNTAPVYMAATSQRVLIVDLNEGGSGTLATDTLSQLTVTVNINNVLGWGDDLREATDGGDLEDGYIAAQSNAFAFTTLAGTGAPNVDDGEGIYLDVNDGEYGKFDSGNATPDDVETLADDIATGTGGFTTFTGTGGNDRFYAGRTPTQITADTLAAHTYTGSGGSGDEIIYRLGNLVNDTAITLRFTAGGMVTTSDRNGTASIDTISGFETLIYRIGGGSSGDINVADAMQGDLTSIITDGARFQFTFTFNDIDHLNNGMVDDTANVTLVDAGIDATGGTDHLNTINYTGAAGATFNISSYNADMPAMSAAQTVSFGSANSIVFKNFRAAEGGGGDDVFIDDGALANSYTGGTHSSGDILRYDDTVVNIATAANNMLGGAANDTIAGIEIIEFAGTTANTLTLNHALAGVTAIDLGGGKDTLSFNDSANLIAITTFTADGDGEEEVDTINYTGSFGIEIDLTTDNRFAGFEIANGGTGADVFTVQEGQQVHNLGANNTNDVIQLRGAFNGVDVAGLDFVRSGSAGSYVVTISDAGGTNSVAVHIAAGSDLETIVADAVDNAAVKNHFTSNGLVITGEPKSPFGNDQIGTGAFAFNDFGMLPASPLGIYVDAHNETYGVYDSSSAPTTNTAAGLMAQEGVNSGDARSGIISVAGRDVLAAPNDNTDGYATFTGTGNNDRFYNTHGAQTYNGGNGIDEIIYDFARVGPGGSTFANSLQLTATGITSGSNANDGHYGIDTLNSIEILRVLGTGDNREIIVNAGSAVTTGLQRIFLETDNVLGASFQFRTAHLTNLLSVDAGTGTNDTLFQFRSNTDRLIFDLTDTDAQTVTLVNDDDSETLLATEFSNFEIAASGTAADTFIIKEGQRVIEFENNDTVDLRGEFADEMTDLSGLNFSYMDDDMGLILTLVISDGDNNDVTLVVNNNNGDSLETALRAEIAKGTDDAADLKAYFSFGGGGAGRIIIDDTPLPPPPPEFGTDFDATLAAAQSGMINFGTLGGDNRPDTDGDDDMPDNPDGSGTQDDEGLYLDAANDEYDVLPATGTDPASPRYDITVGDGSTGFNNFTGTDGNDRFYTADGDQTYNGGAGEDEIIYATDRVSLPTSNYSLTLTGTSFNFDSRNSTDTVINTFTDTVDEIEILTLDNPTNGISTEIIVSGALDGDLTQIRISGHSAFDFSFSDITHLNDGDNNNAMANITSIDGVSDRSAEIEYTGSLVATFDLASAQQTVAVDNTPNDGVDNAISIKLENFNEARGSAGADTFIIGNGHTANGFGIGEDIIDLRGGDFDSVTAAGLDGLTIDYPNVATQFVNGQLTFSAGSATATANLLTGPDGLSNQLVMDLNVIYNDNAAPADRQAAIKAYFINNATMSSGVQLRINGTDASEAPSVAAMPSMFTDTQGDQTHTGTGTAGGGAGQNDEVEYDFSGSNYGDYSSGLAINITASGVTATETGNSANLGTDMLTDIEILSFIGAGFENVSVTLAAAPGFGLQRINLEDETFTFNFSNVAHLAGITIVGADDDDLAIHTGTVAANNADAIIEIGIFQGFSSLTGGVGADTFILEDGDNIVDDFGNGADVIQLRGFDDITNAADLTGLTIAYANGSLTFTAGSKEVEIRAAAGHAIRTDLDGLSDPTSDDLKEFFTTTKTDTQMGAFGQLQIINDDNTTTTPNEYIPPVSGGGAFGENFTASGDTSFDFSTLTGLPTAPMGIWADPVSGFYGSYNSIGEVVALNHVLSGYDNITGTTENDRFFDGQGNHTYTGNGGMDDVVYEYGTNYSSFAAGNIAITVSATTVATEFTGSIDAGTDTLTGIEILRFDAGGQATTVTLEAKPTGVKEIHMVNGDYTFNFADSAYLADITSITVNSRIGLTPSVVRHTGTVAGGNADAVIDVGKIIGFRVEGGVGDDTFVLNPNSTNVVRDYGNGTDVIRLSGFTEITDAATLAGLSITYSSGSLVFNDGTNPQSTVGVHADLQSTLQTHQADLVGYFRTAVADGGGIDRLEIEDTNGNIVAPTERPNTRPAFGNDVEFRVGGGTAFDFTTGFSDPENVPAGIFVDLANGTYGRASALGTTYGFTGYTDITGTAGDDIFIIDETARDGGFAFTGNGGADTLRFTGDGNLRVQSSGQVNSRVVTGIQTIEFDGDFNNPLDFDGTLSGLTTVRFGGGTDKLEFDNIAHLAAITSITATDTTGDEEADTVYNSGSNGATLDLTTGLFAEFEIARGGSGVDTFGLGSGDKAMDFGNGADIINLIGFTGISSTDIAALAIDYGADNTLTFTVSGQGNATAHVFNNEMLRTTLAGADLKAYFTPGGGAAGQLQIDGNTITVPANTIPPAPDFRTDVSGPGTGPFNFAEDFSDVVAVPTGIFVDVVDGKYGDAAALTTRYGFTGYTDITGTAGNDIFIIGDDTGGYSFTGNGGADTLRYIGTNPLRVAANGTANTNTLAAIQTIDFKNADGTDNTADNTLNLQAALTGLTAIDFSNGNDTLRFSNAAHLSGIAFTAAGGGDKLDYSAGTAAITFDLTDAAGQFAQFENAVGGSGGDTFIGNDAGEEVNKFTGGGGNDTFTLGVNDQVRDFDSGGSFGTDVIDLVGFGEEEIVISYLSNVLTFAIGNDSATAMAVAEMSQELNTLDGADAVNGNLSNQELRDYFSDGGGGAGQLKIGGDDVMPLTESAVEAAALDDIALDNSGMAGTKPNTTVIRMFNVDVGSGPRNSFHLDASELQNPDDGGRAFTADDLGVLINLGGLADADSGSRATWGRYGGPDDAIDGSTNIIIGTDDTRRAVGDHGFGAVTGTAGQDWIRGRTGTNPQGISYSDILFGAGGNDILHGAGGDPGVADLLIGGSGADTLTGGGGADVYVIDNGDYITRVGAGQTIHLVGAGFKDVTEATLAELGFAYTVNTDNSKFIDVTATVSGSGESVIWTLNAGLTRALTGDKRGSQTDPDLQKGYIELYQEDNTGATDSDTIRAYYAGVSVGPFTEAGTDIQIGYTYDPTPFRQVNQRPVTEPNQGIGISLNNDVYYNIEDGNFILGEAYEGSYILTSDNQLRFFSFDFDSGERQTTQDQLQSAVLDDDQIGISFSNGEWVLSFKGDSQTADDDREFTISNGEEGEVFTNTAGGDNIINTEAEFNDFIADLAGLIDFA